MIKKKEDSMQLHSYNPETKKYAGLTECQIDPLESKKQGRNVFLTPQYTTPKAPLEPKDGFDVLWNGTDWEYKEIEKPEEPKPYEPTQLELKQQELWETEAQLAKMDYIGTKIATGRATIEDYADKITLMSELAAKVDALRAEIKELEATDGE